MHKITVIKRRDITINDPKGWDTHWAVWSWSLVPKTAQGTGWTVIMDQPACSLVPWFIPMIFVNECSEPWRKTASVSVIMSSFKFSMRSAKSRSGQKQFQCLPDWQWPFLSFWGRLLSASSFHAFFFQVINDVMSLALCLQEVCQTHTTKGVKRSNHGEIICCCKNPKGKSAWLQEGGWVLCVQVCDIQVSQRYTG